MLLKPDILHFCVSAGPLFKMNIGVSPRNGVRQTFLPVYLQQQQHKVMRVKLERRLGSPFGWHRNTSCTNRKKRRGFLFFFFKHYTDGKYSRLGRRNGLFFSTEKSFQYLGSPRRPKTAPLASKAAFILFHFNAVVRK